MMNKDKSLSSWVPIRTLSFFLLLFLPLLYAALFRSNPHDLLKKNQIKNWSEESSSHTNISNRIHNHSKLINKEAEGDDPISFLIRRLVRGSDRTELDATGFSCDSSLNSELCVAKEPVRIDTRSLTVYLSPKQSLPPVNRTAYPYAKKEGNTPMSTVTKVEILRGFDNKPPPPCDVTHNVSAVIFSGGFVQNVYHELSEIIIPLFLTTHHFRYQVRFILTDVQAWWVPKYHRILTHLSHYDNVINPTEDGKVHCFPGAVIGLKYHGFLACNTSDIPGGYSMNDFRRFLRDSFSLKIKNVTEIEKPVLLLISRPKTRMLLNERDVVRLATELGFQVNTATPNRMSHLDKFAGDVNSCSVLLGVHGAGLTNELFLPDGAVLLQVVPLGLDWPSKFYYGDTGRAMNVRHLEYRVNPEESSLLEKYGPDHPVITDPQSIHRQGYAAARAVYIDGQNVKLDLLRFRETLVQALKLIGKSKSP